MGLSEKRKIQKGKGRSGALTWRGYVVLGILGKEGGIQHPPHVLL
jgi:hypothetical protein